MTRRAPQWTRTLKTIALPWQNTITTGVKIAKKGRQNCHRWALFHTSRRSGVLALNSYSELCSSSQASIPLMLPVARPMLVSAAP